MNKEANMTSNFLFFSSSGNLKKDKKRRISPLRMTKNAVIVDTSKLTIKQMERKLVNLVKEKIKIKYGNL